jgi:XTP/dITP diphosphohydrolase
VLPAGRVHVLAGRPASEPTTTASGLVDMARASEGSLVYLVDPDGEGELLAQLTGMADAGSCPDVGVRVVAGSFDLPGARVIDLVRVMDRLRSPGGCPWDAAQTHRSLVPYLLEESYETVEAIETGDDAGLREELGDVLLQVAFHARLAAERSEGPWGIDEVAADVVDKLVRRHPHVFGDAHAPTPEAVADEWDRRKATEKGRRSPAEGVPLAQPALSLAAALLDRAARAGRSPFDAPAAQSGGPQARQAVGSQGGDPFSDEQALGAMLLELVAHARAAGLDPERALRGAARRLAAQLGAGDPTS